MKFRDIAMAACLTALYLPAYGANDNGVTGNDWHSICNNKKADRPGGCDTYVVGVVSGIKAQAAITSTKEPFCAPPKVSYQQYADIFFKYLDNHPEQRHELAVILALQSWRDAFPCSK